MEGERPIRIGPVRFVDIANASMICSNLVFKNIHLEYLIHVLYIISPSIGTILSILSPIQYLTLSLN